MVTLLTVHDRGPHPFAIRAKQKDGDVFAAAGLAHLAFL
jgi:hypothetical protein